MERRLELSWKTELTLNIKKLRREAGALKIVLRSNDATPHLRTGSLYYVRRLLLARGRRQS